MTKKESIKLAAVKIKQLEQKICLKVMEMKLSRL